MGHFRPLDVFKPLGRFFRYAILACLLHKEYYAQTRGRMCSDWVQSVVGLDGVLKNFCSMNIRRNYHAVLCCLALLARASTVQANPVTNQVISLTSPWRYTTNNVDAANWLSVDYNDASWSGPSNGLFYMESAALPAAKSTPLPPQADGSPLSCYYFRTRFTVTNISQVVALDVGHLVDDGAVFYLNGAEIQRVRMGAGSVVNATQAYATPTDGDATSIESFAVVGGLRASLLEGTNVLAARVHQYGTASSDVVFGAQVATVRDARIRLTRGPYLMVCTPSSIVIRWRTDLEENSCVRYGASPANLSLDITDSAFVTEHVVVVTNLAPDTLYYYSIGSSSRVLAGGDATCSFRTHPLPGQPQPLRLWVTGDAGTANANAQAVRDAFESANGTNTVHAWLQLGGNAYSTGTDLQYQAAMFDMYAARLRQTPVWTTMANHETYSTDGNGLYPYLNIFTMPTLGEAGGIASQTKLYYSFDIGMVHFISLDSMISDRSSSGDMADWLRADLAAVTSRWVVAFFHHPPYTKGSHNSDTEIELIEMRQNIVPILEAGGVDLVLCGHSHSYERSFLLDGHYGSSASLTSAMILNRGDGAPASLTGAYAKPENAFGAPIGNCGTVYAVVGCSGKTSGGSLDHPAMYISKNNLGSMVLGITPDRLDAIVVRETGATNDSFTITKKNYAPVASNTLSTVAADRSVQILLTASDVNRNPLTFSVSSLPTNGLVSGFNSASGALTYTPAHGNTGVDRIGFVATDGKLVSSSGVVTVHVQPLADTDSDGMPDEWETLHGLEDPSGDPDQDGVMNVQEYQAGTDPKDKQSWLRMTDGNPGGAGFQVVWSSVGGTRYRILYSDGDIRGGFNGLFTPLPRPVTDEMDPHPPGTPGAMSFTDDFTVTGMPPPHGSRFFRISVVRQGDNKL
jgi:hypothetical protein